MDPLFNSKMILLNEIKQIQNLGLDVPGIKVLTPNDYLDEIIYYNQLLKQQYLQKYGKLHDKESKKQQLEKSVNKFLTHLFELNNAINEYYSFDPHKMMLDHMERFSIKHNYNFSRDHLDSILKMFIKNKLMS